MRRTAALAALLAVAPGCLGSGASDKPQLEEGSNVADTTKVQALVADIAKRTEELTKLFNR